MLTNFFNLHNKQNETEKSSNQVCHQITYIGRLLDKRPEARNSTRGNTHFAYSKEIAS